MPDREAPTSPADASPVTASPGRAPRARHVVGSGELDMATVPSLDWALRRAEHEATLVVLDLRGVTFMDSSGAHLAVDSDRRMRMAGGRLVVVRPSPSAGRVFTLLGLDEQLTLVDRPLALVAPGTTPSRPT